MVSGEGQPKTLFFLMPVVVEKQEAEVETKWISMY